MKMNNRQHRLLDAVDAAAEAVEKSESKLAVDTAELHRKIKAAANAHVPRTRLAEAARKSRRWLYNLLEA